MPVPQEPITLVTLFSGDDRAGGLSRGKVCVSCQAALHFRRKGRAARRWSAKKLVAPDRALIPGRELNLPDEPFEDVVPVRARRRTFVIADLREDGLTVLTAESETPTSRIWQTPERDSVSAGREHAQASTD